MIVVKVFVWYFAVIFCYARNIFLWKGQLGILLVVLVFSSVISIKDYMRVYDNTFTTAVNNAFRYGKTTEFQYVSLWTRNLKWTKISFSCKYMTSYKFLSWNIWSRSNHSHFSSHCTKKLSFPLRISSVNVTRPQFSANLVTFTESLNGILHFLCSVLKINTFS